MTGRYYYILKVQIIPNLDTKNFFITYTDGEHVILNNMYCQAMITFKMNS
jgi:hypothetical protein